jgi:hypothetical protein
MRRLPLRCARSAVSFLLQLLIVMLLLSINTVLTVFVSGGEVFSIRLDGGGAVAQGMNDEGALASSAMAPRGYACTSLQGPRCVSDYEEQQLPVQARRSRYHSWIGCDSTLISFFVASVCVCLFSRAQSFLSGEPDLSQVSTAVLTEMLRQVLAHTVKAAAASPTSTAGTAGTAKGKDGAKRTHHVVGHAHLQATAKQQQQHPSSHRSSTSEGGGSGAGTGVSSSSSLSGAPKEIHIVSDDAGDARSASNTARLRALLQDTIASHAAEPGRSATMEELKARATAREEKERLKQQFYSPALDKLHEALNVLLRQDADEDLAGAKGAAEEAAAALKKAATSDDVATNDAEGGDEEDEELFEVEIGGLAHTMRASELAAFVQRANAGATSPDEELHLEFDEEDEGGYEEEEYYEEDEPLSDADFLRSRPPGRQEQP